MASVSIAFGEDDYRYAQGRAVAIVGLAVRAGRLPNLKRIHVRCTDCPKRAAHYDHRDYSLPLNVAPVCCSCNIRRRHAIVSEPLRTYMWLRQRYDLQGIYDSLNALTTLQLKGSSHEFDDEIMERLRRRRAR
jgi:hypothetical protein